MLRTESVRKRREQTEGKGWEEDQASHLEGRELFHTSVDESLFIPLCSNIAITWLFIGETSLTNQTIWGSRKLGGQVLLEP